MGKYDELLLVGSFSIAAYYLNIFGFRNLIDGILGKKTTTPQPQNCQAGYHKDAQGNCIPDIVQTTLFSDAFPSSYVLNGGNTSPDGKWYCEYTGGGSVGTRTSSDGKRVLYMYPAIAISSTGSDTHASQVLTTQTFTNFELTFRMRTIRQLRQNFPPKNWEVGWVMWSYSNRADLNNRSVNHYYFVPKPHGDELGKKDNIETNPALEQQIFLGGQVGNVDVVIGQWYDVKVRFKDFHIQVWMGATLIYDITDVPNNPTRMRTGKIGLYCEDAEVEFTDVMVKSV